LINVLPQCMSRRNRQYGIKKSSSVCKLRYVFKAWEKLGKTDSSPHPCIPLHCRRHVVI
jgi:hypothetical protein